MMIINSGRGVTQIILAMATHKLPVEITSKVARSTSGETLAEAGKGGRMEQRTGPLGFRVEVTLPNVASLRISGAGNVTYQDINQDELSLDVSGAGTIEVTGKVNRLEADVSGAGDIAAYLLSATHGRLRVSGAAISRRLLPNPLWPVCRASARSKSLATRLSAIPMSRVLARSSSSMATASEMPSQRLLPMYDTFSAF
jgi:hypothetical protein